MGSLFQWSFFGLFFNPFYHPPGVQTQAVLLKHNSPWFPFIRTLFHCSALFLSLSTSICFTGMANCGVFVLLKQYQVRLSLSHTSPCMCLLSARAFHTPTGLGPLSSMTLHDGWALGPSNQPHHRRGLCALSVSPPAPHSECQTPTPPHPAPHTLLSSSWEPLSRRARRGHAEGRTFMRCRYLPSLTKTHCGIDTVWLLLFQVFKFQVQWVAGIAGCVWYS